MELREGLAELGRQEKEGLEASVAGPVLVDSDVVVWAWCDAPIGSFHLETEEEALLPAAQ